jgi:hypothetical protein
MSGHNSTTCRRSAQDVISLPILAIAPLDSDTIGRIGCQLDFVGTSPHQTGWDFQRYYSTESL